MRRLILLLIFAAVSSASAKESPRLFRAEAFLGKGQDSLKVWVFFKDKGAFPGALAVAQKAAERIQECGDRELALETERPVAAEYLQTLGNHGTRVWQVSRWLNAASIWISPEKLKEIERLPFVAGFRPVVKFVRKPEPVEPPEVEVIEKATEQPLAPMYADQYGPTLTQLDSLNIPILHTLGYRGQGVIEGMLDDGFKTGHSAFDSLFANGQVLAQYDFIQKDMEVDSQAGDAAGQGNHGTETWSVVGGNLPGSFLGGAYKADFVLAKTEYDPTEHKVEEDNWVAGLEWADSIGAGVISSSLGYFDFDPPDPSYTYADLDGRTAVTSVAASMAADLGILVCNAAGNGGPADRTLVAPADAFDILACGAVDSFGTLVSFSSRGPTADGRIKPELLAQGSRTYLANPSNFSGFTRGSGTSFATPLIACAATVMRNIHPDWSPRQIREALLFTAGNRLAPNNQKGWGVPDVFAAAQFRPDSTVTLEVLPVGNVPPASSSYQIRVVIHNPRSLPVSSPRVLYREITDLNFSPVPLTMASADTFAASIPISASSREIVFYAEVNGLVTDPVFAPTWVYRLMVAPQRFADEGDLGPSKWKTSGTGASWGPSARSAYSVNFSFSDSPRGNYANNADVRWEMRNGIQFNPATSYFARFFERYVLASGDSVWVEASTDGGPNWALVGTKKTGNLGTWSERIVSLGAYPGASDFRLRFRLKSDASATADGWQVDDISILMRGDLNGDGLLTGADIVLALNFVYLNILPPAPSAAADMNGDLLFTAADLVCLLNSAFLGSSCPAP